MHTVAVVDYGSSNLRSVARALEHVGGRGTRVLVTSSGDDLRRADRVVFPGQGAIGDCMRSLTAHGLVDALCTSIARKPFLGICLGLQSLLESSEEEPAAGGLALFSGQVIRFAARLTDPATGQRLKVPHMGWNEVVPTRPHPLWRDIAAGSRFYFVHSYFVAPADAALVAATTTYGVSFAAALARDSVFAIQFHPEKSQRDGLQLLENFLAWDGAS